MSDPIILLSPFGNLHNAIIDRLTTALSKTNLRYIDQDLGQLENYDPSSGGMPAVTWPCCLFDMEDFEFEEEGENTQRAEGYVMIRIGFKPIGRTNNLTPVDYRNQALRNYEVEWLIHKALHCWSPGDGYGSFSRVKAITEKREDLIRVRAIRYKFAFVDKSTLLPIGTAHAPFEFELKVVMPPSS